MADLSGLTGDARSSLMLALDELRKAGVKATVSSAFRSPEKQAALYADRANNPFPVAPPGHSAHERGTAADIALTDEGQREKATQILARHGFNWRLGNKDRVHYEYDPGAAAARPLAVGETGGHYLTQYPLPQANLTQYPLPKAKAAPADDYLTQYPLPRAAPKAAASGYLTDFPLPGATMRPRNPNVKLGAHGRVIDPTTGQEFEKGRPHENAQPSLTARALEVVTPGTEKARDLAFKALSLPFDPLTAAVNDISAKAMQGERDKKLGPYLGPIAAAGKAMISSAPRAAVKGLLSPTPVKPDFFTPEGYDTPGRPGGINLPISLKVNDYAREALNLGSSTFAVDPAAAAAYRPFVTTAGRAALAAADKVGALDRKLPVIGKTARQLTEDAALRQATNRRFVKGDAHTAALLREGEAHVKEAEGLYQGLAKKGVKLAAKTTDGRRVNALDEYVGHWLEAGREGATYDTGAAAAAKKLTDLTESAGARGLTGVHAGTAQADATLSRVLTAAGTKGKAAAQEAAALPGRTEALMAEAGRTKGRAAVQAAIERAPGTTEQMLARGRQAVKGLLNEGAMHDAADAAALVQYNEVTNALRQTLPPGELAEILSRMKQAGRDAVARAVEEGGNADRVAAAAAQAAKDAAQSQLGKVLASAGTAGKAKIQSLIQSEARAAQAAREVLDRAVAVGRSRGLPAVQKGQEAADAALSSAVATGGGKGAARVSYLKLSDAEKARLPLPVSETVRTSREAVLKDAEQLSSDPAVQQQIRDTVERIGSNYSRLWRQTGHALERLGYLHPGTTEGMGGQYLSRLYHSASRNPADIETWLKVADEAGASPEAVALGSRLAAREPGGGFYNPAQKRKLTTEAQREAHGAERQASVLFAHGGGAQARLVGRGSALQAIAETPGLASKVQEPGSVLMHGRQYGPLAGHWVPGAVKQVVDRNVSRLPTSAWEKVMEKFAGTVKGLWTTANGPVMAFNYLNNRMLAEGEAAMSKAGHFTEGDIISGAKQILQWRRGGTVSPAVKGLLEHSRAFNATGADLIGEARQSLRRSVGIDTAAQKAAKGVGKALGATRNLLDFQRKAVKVGLMDKLLKAGYSPEEAAIRVERAEIDYKNTSEAAETLDRLGIVPFARHISEGTKQVGRILATHPDIPLRYSGLRLGQAIAGAEGGDVQKQWEPGQIPIPSFLPGSRDAAGNPLSVSGGLATLNPFKKGEHGLQGFLGGGVFAPIVDVARNQNSYTQQPIVPPGTPPEDERRLRLQYLAQGYAPPLAPFLGRSWQRITAAEQGVPFTSGRTTEPQSVPESLAQSLLGVRVTHAEAPVQKMERMSPVIDQRAGVSGQFVDAVDDQLSSGQGTFPERESYRQMAAGWDEVKTRMALRDVKSLLKRKLMDPTLFDRHGQLTEGGKGQLRRLTIYLNVLADLVDGAGQQ